MKELAVVLSGGGARGAIQLGVMQALDEYKLAVQWFYNENTWGK